MNPALLHKLLASTLPVFLVFLLAGCASQATDAASPTNQVVNKNTGSKMLPKDADAITAYHAKVRKDVGVGPLKWSPKLATFAQQWTDHLAASSCGMVHRQPNNYGENLFMGTDGYYHAADAAKAWADEKKLYPGGALKESTWHPAGHYTQMVWRGTAFMGCGQSVCRKTIIIACNYDPPGNFMGRKPY